MEPKKTEYMQVTVTRIIVEKISFHGLSKDVDGDGCVTKLRGKSVPRQRARWAERPWTERRGRRAGMSSLCSSAERKCVQPVTVFESINS